MGSKTVWLPTLFIISKSYRFGTTQGSVNDDKRFIFGCTITLTSLTRNIFLVKKNLCKQHSECSLQNKYLLSHPKMHHIQNNWKTNHHRLSHWINSRESLSLIKWNCQGQERRLLKKLCWQLLLRDCRGWDKVVIAWVSDDHEQMIFHSEVLSVWKSYISIHICVKKLVKNCWITAFWHWVCWHDR